MGCWGHEECALGKGFSHSCVPSLCFTLSRQTFSCRFWRPPPPFQFLLVNRQEKIHLFSEWSTWTNYSRNSAQRIDIIATSPFHFVAPCLLCFAALRFNMSTVVVSSWWLFYQCLVFHLLLEFLTQSWFSFRSMPLPHIFLGYHLYEIYIFMLSLSTYLDLDSNLN